MVMVERFELSKSDIEDIKNLKRYYNIVEEGTGYDYRASRRVEISRKGAIFFLKWATILNLLTCMIIGFTIGVFAFKPSPLYYATHPSGSVYGPLPKIK